MEGFERKRTVVIVGGGIAGAQLAKSIEQIVDVILIDPKEYFEIPWANLRSKVEPSFAERSVINHKEYLKNGKVIVSNAVDVTEQGVVTAEGRRVPYDYLVIATGHPYTTIRGRRDRLEKFQEGFRYFAAPFFLFTDSSTQSPNRGPARVLHLLSSKQCQVVPAMSPLVLLPLQVHR